MLGMLVLGCVMVVVLQTPSEDCAGLGMHLLVVAT